MDNSKRVVNLRNRSNKIALALASIHFYSGICTGTGNIFIGEFCMNMLRWFWESTPKWLSFKKRLSFWLQLAYWYGQMGNKDWHFRVAWPGGEPLTSRVTGRCLIHYTTSDSVNYDGFTRTLSSVNIKSTNFEEKTIPGIYQAPGHSRNPAPLLVLRTGCGQASLSDACSISQVRKMVRCENWDRD